jgi:hypothetical protein
VAGGWRRLHNDELHNLYPSPNVIRVIKSGSMRWAEQVARTGDMRSAYNSLVGKPEGSRIRGSSSRRWEENIKMYLRKTEYDGVDWMHLTKDMDHGKCLW